MPESYEAVAQAAMQLPLGERARLAEDLLADVDVAATHTSRPTVNGGLHATEEEKTVTLTLDLPPEIEQALRDRAAREGKTVDQLVTELLEAHLEKLEQERREKAIAMVQSFIDEGDGEEQRETWEYLVRVLDEDRTSYRKLFPPELKGISW